MMEFGPDAELRRISSKYLKMLCDLSQEVHDIGRPRSSEIVVIYLPYHRLEFQPAEQKKCKECGK